MKRPGPKPGDAQYEKMDSHPSNAQSNPQSKKNGVVYAELGSRPANAPVVLTPAISVQYVIVNTRPIIPKDMVSIFL